MSQVLVIKAHPLTAENSRSVAALDAFVEAYKIHHPQDTLEILDVYESFIPEIDQHLLTSWKAARNNTPLTTEQETTLARFDALTEQFLTSDKIVIANALWNLNVPTRLKAWLDTIMVSGKTFKYTENGPIGLTSGKKMLHIQSNGGLYGGNEPGSQYLETIFNFLGVSNIQHVFVEGVDHSPERAEEIIQAAHKKATDIAKVF